MMTFAPADRPIGPAAPRPGGPAPHRVSFRFSARGDRAAFLRDAGGPGLGVETWTWRDGAPRRRTLSTRGETLYSQPVPLDDGRVLVLRSGAGVHDVVLLTPGRAEAAVGRIESRGCYLLPRPNADAPAVARALNDDGTVTLWLIKPASPGVEAVSVCSLPSGILGTGHWLDDGGRVLGFDCHAEGRTRIIAVDLASGEVCPASFAGNCRLLLSDPGSGRFLVGEDGGGARRFGWGRWGRGAWELTFPAALGEFDGTVTPLAINPSDDAVAFCVESGLRSEVAIRAPGRGAVSRRSFPSGTIFPVAGWTSGGLHLVVSRPDQPANIMTVVPGADRCLTHADPAPPGGWAPAHAETLAGPAGSIEAVIYGGPHWRDSGLLLVALHGGPHAAWRLCFDPLFQDLAAAGVAVVAPNQRGSVGHDAAHRDAIRGAWGGPDLSDVTHLAATVSAYRQRHGLPRLRLLGVSYGAFLALLASAARPELWSHCAAISAFSSADSLYAVGPDNVRSFLRRLDALGTIDDVLGPRDLERLADRITARLFIAHGTGDEKIPVSEPRRILAALERAGRRSGADFCYREVPDGHDILHGAGGADLPRRLVQFLTSAEANSGLAIDADPKIGVRQELGRPLSGDGDRAAIGSGGAA
jgi:dienelactone hydrolase